jgi:non-specific serine/threonine protein kinase
MVEPSFTVTDQNAQVVAQVCQRLDGIPLAIELAAARVRMFSLEQIAARLDDRFRLLTEGSRTALPRQQTLRATIDWSYELLPEVEQRLLRRLSVFAGGWSLEAVEVICAGEGVKTDDVLNVLTQLVNKSIVIAEEQHGKIRYRLLETMRQYTLEKLLGAGELERLRQSHWEWFLRFVEQAEPNLRRTGQQVWIEQLEIEHDNIRAVLSQSLEAGETETAARLAGALWQFWITHGHFVEGRKWLDAILANSNAIPVVTRSKVLFGAGELARHQGDFERARLMHGQRLILHRDLGDKEGIADALNYLGWVEAFQCDHERATALCQESLALYQELGNKQGIGSSLNGLALAALFRRDYKQSAALSEESITIRRGLEDKLYLVYSLPSLGWANLLQGDYKRAIVEHKLI